MDVEVQKNAAGRAHLLNPAGDPVTLPMEQVEAAVRAGYRPETSESISARREKKEFGGVGQQVLTAAERAASGATLGLSDVALGAALGPEYGQNALLRQKYNPITATAAEIGGAVAPLLAGDPASLLGKGLKTAGTVSRLASEGAGVAGELAGRGVAALAGEGRLARLGARAAELAVTGGTEGALYSAGQKLGELTLSDDDLTAEKLVSAGVDGAGYGALAGLGLGAIGGLVGKAADSINLKKLKREGVLDSLGVTASDEAKIAGRRGSSATKEAKLQALSDDIFDYKLRSGPLQGKKIFSGAKKAEDFLDDLSQAKEELGSEISAVREKVADAPVDLRSFIQRVDADVIKPMREGGSHEMGKRANKIEREIAPWRARLKAIETPPKQIAPEELGIARRDGAPLRLVPPEPVLPPTHAEMEAFRKNLADIAYPKKPAGGGPPPPVEPGMEKLQKVERILDEQLDDVVLKHVTPDEGLKYLADQRLQSSMMTAEDVASKAARRQGHQGPGLGGNATGLAAALFAMSSGNLGAFGSAISGAAAASAYRTIKQHAPSMIAQMANGLLKLDTRVDGIAAKFRLAGKVVRSGVVKAASHHDYGAVSQTVRQFQNDPQKRATVVANMTHGLSEYPDILAKTQTVILGDMAYLNSVLPKVPGNTLTPLAKVRAPSVGDQKKFLKRYGALFDPPSVLENLEKGVVDRDAIETLKIRRPAFFEEIRSKVIGQVSQREEELPYLTKVQLSLAFDFEGDESLDPGMIRAIQSAGDPPKEQPAMRSRNVNDDAAKNMQLPSEVT